MDNLVPQAGRQTDYKIIIPDINECLDQNEEYFYVNYKGEKRRLLCHDYDEIYKIPGLYEKFFYGMLKCDSPNVVCELLEEEMKNLDEADVSLRVLDFGAGNGMVGERIQEMDCDLMVGVDIIPEAKEAALRDRPGVYDDYYIMDMNQLNQKRERQFKDYEFNALVTVAALGFGDIPTKAFLNAFNLVEDDSWIAFNIKDRFLSDEDNTGYRALMDNIMDDSLEILQEKDYIHRMSVTGEELCYRAIVGRKTGSIADALIDMN